jgi:uncharacterized membrane protein YcaP (DUF421 family)
VEYLLITGRIISIMGLLLFLVLITGRRKIGELPVFDFLTIIILANVVGADIADPSIPHLPTAYAVVLLIGIQYLISLFALKNRKFGKKVTFKPVAIIQNGKFIRSNMTKVRYSLENVLMFLREKGIFDLNEVEFAIVEDSGNISVQKKSQFQPLTPGDMNLPTNYKGLSLPLIIDGTVIEDNLVRINLDKRWLASQLASNKIDNVKDVFYADINTTGKLYISKMIETEFVTNESLIK